MLFCPKNGHKQKNRPSKNMGGLFYIKRVGDIGFEPMTPCL
jgi:hypothetical protein